MKQAPNMWSIPDLLEHIKSGPRVSSDGEKWLPARPLGFYSFGSRLGIAWYVFTGRADALVWPEQP